MGGLMSCAADRTPHSQLFLPEDVIDGSKMNPVSLIAAALLPVAALISAFAISPVTAQLSGLTRLLASVGIGGLGFALAFISFIVLVKNSVNLIRLASIFLIGFFDPLWLLMFPSLGGFGFDQVKAFSGMFFIMAALWFSFDFVAGFLTNTFPSLREKQVNVEVFRGAVKMAFIILALSIVCKFILPQSLLPIGALLIGSLAPYSLYRSWILERAFLLEANGRMFDGIGANYSFNHINARKSQAENASSDKSPLIRLGTATGKLRSNWDFFAPDKGLPFVMSAKDLSLHMLVLGSSGSGKTASMGRPLGVQWLAQGCGGILVLDGKGYFAEEFKLLPNFTLIEPWDIDLNTNAVIKKGTVLNLIEGVEPGFITETLASSVGGESDTGGGDKGNAAFFKNSALEMGKHCEHILYWLVKKDERDEQVALEAGLSFDRRWWWNLASYINVVDMLADTGNVEIRGQAKRKIVHWIDDLLNNPPAEYSTNNYQLAEAIKYICVTYPSLNEETTKNIMASLRVWFSPLTSNRNIIPWLKETKSEIDVSAPLRGQGLGVCLPKTVFGDAAVAATNLIRGRVMKEIRGRKDDWRDDPHQKPVLILMDEAQDILTTKDKDWLAVSRSQGGQFCVMTQSIEALVERLGKEATEAMLPNFGSFVMFTSSHQTQEWVINKMGRVAKKMGPPKNSVDLLSFMETEVDKPIFNINHQYAKGLFSRLLSRNAVRFNLTELYDINTDKFIKDNAVNSSRHWSMGPEGKGFPVADKSALTSYTLQPGHCVAQVIRGAVHRRDALEMKYMSMSDMEKAIAKIRENMLSDK